MSSEVKCCGHADGICCASLTADSASMKDLVPDRAMVPRLLTRSALVMPMPLSWIANVLLDLSCNQADVTEVNTTARTLYSPDFRAMPKEQP